MSGTGAVKSEGPYTYDAYGNCFLGATANACTSAGEPYRFTGRRFDPETGLTYYRARYYSAALGRFLETDPVGYTADLNLYAYVGNDPTNLTDPTGLASYIVAREILFQGSGIYHMFIVVAPSLGAKPEARFSYAPSQGYDPLSSRPLGSLVEQRGFNTGTNQGDTVAWNSLGGKNLPSNVSVSSINASDAAVIKSGNAIDQKLGDMAHPGNVTYAPVENPLSDSDTANSNSAAMAVANGALGNGQQQPLPRGVRAPGWGQSGNVTNAKPPGSDQQKPQHTCTGSRIPTGDACTSF